jgi:hypothetical protein
VKSADTDSEVPAPNPDPYEAGPNVKPDPYEA